MSVIRANFQFKFNCNVEVTYARTLEKRCFCLYFPPLLQLCLPPNHQNCAKVAHNLPSKMMLYFMKCTHFSYMYSYMSILYHSNFSYDLIHSLILFYHPFSKCAHLNATHYGLKMYVNG